MEDGHEIRMSRREFMKGASALSVYGFSSPFLIGEEKVKEPIPKPTVRPTIRGAFLRPAGRYWFGWPGTAYPVDAMKSHFSEGLGEWARKLGIQLEIEEQPLFESKDVERFISDVKGSSPNAILLIPLHMDRWGMVEQIVNAFTPAIIFAPIGISFTGHIGGISRKPGVYLVSSMEIEAVAFGMKMVKALEMLKRTRALMLVGNETRDVVIPKMGVKLHYIPRERFVEELRKVGETEEVKAIADDYAKRARAIKEPKASDMMIAARMYIASRNLLRSEDSHAISMDCLGLESSGLIPGPPCLAWSKLLDEGVAAACEGDVGAMLTHLTVLYLFDKPGFQQDPVSETVHNSWIGAHCTSPTCLNGLGTQPEPFILRSHAESDQGVSMQVLFRKGQKVTIADLEGEGPDYMLIGTGTVVDNISTPPAGGCRTSVECIIDNCTDSRNVRGFHQIVFYGDHARQLQAFCQFIGIRAEPLAI